jgi:hypothetical protein
MTTGLDRLSSLFDPSTDLPDQAGIQISPPASPGCLAGSASRLSAWLIEALSAQ